LDDYTIVIYNVVENQTNKQRQEMKTETNKIAQTKKERKTNKQNKPI